jgi:hypothetical protein
MRLPIAGWGMLISNIRMGLLPCLGSSGGNAMEANQKAEE